MQNTFLPDNNSRFNALFLFHMWLIFLKTDTPMRRENQTFRRPREQPEAEGWTGFSDKNVRAKFIRKVSALMKSYRKEFSFLFEIFYVPLELQSQNYHL